MIAGLELPTSGQIFLGDEDVTFKRASHRDIAFVFQLFALYPHMNVRRNIAFPLVSQGMPRARDRRQGGRGGAHPAHRAPARQAGVGPVQRRPPARRARPRDRAPAAGLHDGRAARRARLRVPRADVPGAARAARPAARHHRLRHARPARGDGDGRHDRDHEPGRDRAARRAAGGVRPAGQRVRRRLHRLAVDELPAASTAATPPARDQVRLGDALLPVPALREDAPAATLLFGVRPEHVRFAGDSALRAEVLGTEYLGTSQIVTCTTRAGHDAARASVGVDAAGAARRPASAWPSTPRRCRCSTRPAAARCAPRATTSTARPRAARAPARAGSRPWLTCGCKA